MLILARNSKHSVLVLGNYDATITMSNLQTKGCKYRFFRLQTFRHGKPEFDTLFSLGLGEQVSVIKYIPKGCSFNPEVLDLKLFYIKPGNTIIIGITAPVALTILREEIYDKFKLQKVS